MTQMPEGLPQGGQGAPSARGIREEAVAVNQRAPTDIQPAYRLARAAIERAAPRHSARLTAARQDILAVILEAGEALSANDIQRRLLVPLNIVTIYRVVEWLEGIGVVKREADSAGVARVLATVDGASPVRFECERCRRVTPLFGVTVPEVQGLPEGHAVTRTTVSLHGVCAACAEAAAAAR